MDHLFIEARKYQERFDHLQNDINNGVAQIQDIISHDLTVSTNYTLIQFEDLKKGVQDMEQPIRVKLATLDNTTECYELQLANLKHAINATVGYQSSTCASIYYGLVNTEIQKMLEGFAKDSNFSFNIQQTVIRSFLSVNVFIHAKEIKDSLEKQFQQANQSFEASKTRVHLLIKDFSSAVSAAIGNFGSCHSDLLAVVTPFFTALSEGVDACAVFIENQKNSAPDSKVPEMTKNMDTFIEDFPIFTFDWNKSSGPPGGEIFEAFMSVY